MNLVPGAIALNNYMINSTIRKLAPHEKQHQAKVKQSTYTRFKEFVLKLIFVVIVLLIPFLIYDHFKPVDSPVQAICLIVILVAAIIITTYITIKAKRFAPLTTQSFEAVEIVKVQSVRAIKRDSFEDFGPSYYFDVIENGRHKVLYLWGQYIDDFEEGTFPNTEFEFTRWSGSDEFIDFKIKGKYFTEERTLPAFEKEIFQKGKFPVNGQLLNLNFDNIE
ncbi:hypothetical protein GCM10023149_43150 [Mucilaginibacter gynuensis]|uniref:Uncharacterized protein n=1 Tax=Mucilaginibacter gynuensis TaxID=1302236 RepID=A0ABP8H7G0_9SPHI